MLCSVMLYQGQTIRSSLKQEKDVNQRDVIDTLTCERYHIFYSVKIRFFSVTEILVIQSNLYINMGNYL